MASASDQDEPPPGRAGLRIGCWAALGTLALLAIALAIIWGRRERIADDYIADQLKKYGVEAKYEIEQIGPRREVLRNLVIGDPGRPDLTVERVEVFVR
ncbi:MAG TPA: hypothetical protein VFS49_03155, partial [Croceibacterium sp.]|nr:hypothetical protein [Croceibacterium sp.]